MITIDNLAHRYHCLPSEALARASTYDKENGIAPKSDHPSQNEMIEMLKRARNEQ